MGEIDIEHDTSPAHDKNAEGRSCVARHRGHKKGGIAVIAGLIGIGASAQGAERPPTYAGAWHRM